MPYCVEETEVSLNFAGEMKNWKQNNMITWSIYAGLPIDLHRPVALRFQTLRPGGGEPFPHRLSGLGPEPTVPRRSTEGVRYGVHG